MNAPQFVRNLLILLFAIAFAVLLNASEFIEPFTKPDITTPNIYLMANGEQCWFDTWPEITFNAETQNIRLEVNCDYEVHYFWAPAAESHE